MFGYVGLRQVWSAFVAGFARRMVPLTSDLSATLERVRAFVDEPWTTGAGRTISPEEHAMLDRFHDDACLGIPRSTLRALLTALARLQEERDRAEKAEKVWASAYDRLDAELITFRGERTRLLAEVSRLTTALQQAEKVGQQVGERHWVCACPLPNNLLDVSWHACPSCSTHRPESLGTHPSKPRRAMRAARDGGTA